MLLRELEWFTTLAETQHMTEASLRLSISQPTLSRALARLERKLGVQLFDRHHSGLRLNKYGEIFHAHAVRAMSEVDRGEERIATLVDPQRGSVSLGFIHSFGGWLVPDLLNGYRKLAPRTSFELHGAACDAVVDEVRDGTVDIGFVAPQPGADDVQWTPLGRERLCLSVPPGHALEGRDQVAIAELAAEPMVVLKTGFGLRQITDSLCGQAGFRACIAIEVTELSTLHALVAAGMGVAVVPASWPEGMPGSTAITVPFSDPTAFRDYGAVTRRGGPGSRAAQRFLGYVAGRAHPAATPCRAADEGTGAVALAPAISV
ncbi:MULTISPECIES: LysR family transcriptional regulator [unclassified Streptomyces]|uniref:LysR family transcriptional regulator n=1 Tax=unclassified Streptomyces TaxID=2593676 RepID=UPI002256E2EB|nr:MULTISPECIES: LysR family transcriptional regulator [unclassified Streptomyces]MCX5435626.1 LysR family transcriptional regulator [Streptomyces sp. NBC_00063]WSE08841.1 LysR family transcriptional regulator [Streptomyces sp. NBC_01445]WSE13422.1 LysR family transcriptional regulator [Streptomyces sp. NBC_01397]WUB97661.1 LysR family transcriptional regulator [Streptomyces sp. NBC_00569]